MNNDYGRCARCKAQIPFSKLSNSDWGDLCPSCYEEYCRQCDEKREDDRCMEEDRLIEFVGGGWDVVLYRINRGSARYFARFDGEDADLIFEKWREEIDGFCELLSERYNVYGRIGEFGRALWVLKDGVDSKDLAEDADISEEEAAQMIRGEMPQGWEYGYSDNLEYVNEDE